MNPPDAQQSFEQGLAHYRAGRPDAAEASLRAAVSANPRHVDALHLLGLVSLARGNPHGAIPLIRRAVQIQPAFPSAWNSLGECYRSLRQVDAAVGCYRDAIAHDPTMAAAHSNLGLALSDAGRWAEAIDACRAAIRHDPDMANAYAILASAHLGQGDAAAALASLQPAIDRGLPDAPIHNNRGTALEALDRLPEALDAYRRAVELAPGLAVAANNYLNVARQLNRWSDALAWTDRALQQSPGFGPVLWNRGLLQLTFGDYANGLPAYELRFAATDQRHPSILTGRPWDGREDLSRRTLVLYAEQGQGDGFQAARYVPIIAGRVGRVAILCHAAQARLFARLPGASTVVTNVADLPPYDRFAALMSLPWFCGTTSLESIPRAVPYLTPPPGVADRWRQRLPRSGDRPKVGLLWAGASRPDPLRTCPLPELSPLLAVAGVEWFSLQVGPAAAALATVPAARDVVDLSPELTDFAETAAAMGQLDLVITIDTSVAHLAGAAGRPTWTLLPFSPDWRWLLDRADSPWYPTMRLFRQPERKQWGPVVERVTAELRTFVAQFRGDDQPQHGARATPSG